MAATLVNRLTIPRLSGLPLLGNLLDLRHRRLELLLRLARECGDIGACRLGPFNAILLNTPELAQAVLLEHVSAFEKTPSVRDLAWPVTGNGLLSSEHEFHKRQRRLVAPAFQHRRITSYADVMVQYTDQLQRSWHEGGQIDITREMMRLTLWIVGKTLFDADVLSKAEELEDAVTTAMHYLMSEVGKPLRIPSHWPTPRNRSVKQATERLNSIIYQIIEEHRAADRDCGDLLSMLLQAKDEDDGTFMSDAQLRDEVMTIFLAGHETVANALAWTYYLLALHPDMYDRMHDEVDQVLAGRLPSLADLPRLPYVLQVFKEAMRLYPPAYVFGRQAQRDITLCGYPIRRGDHVFVSPYTLHRRTDYFPDPERFDPERFSPQKEQSLPRYAYLPFGAGPRVCIGNHFALMEAHLILATLAQRVRFEFAGQYKVLPDPLVTLRPSGSILMHVQRL